MTKWEYLTVTWQSRTRLVEGAWKYDAELTIRKPNGEREQRRIPDPSDAMMLVFGELGASGWEMVTALVAESAIGGARRGYQPCSAPVGLYYVFKRPI